VPVQKTQVEIKALNWRRRNIRISLLLAWGLMLLFGLLSISWPAGPVVNAAASTGQPDSSVIHHADALTSHVYLPPITETEVCQPIPGESFGVLRVNPPPTDRPAEAHADLNLALRGHQPVTAHVGPIDYSGSGDPSAPRFAGLFWDSRSSAFSSVYQVHDWNWGCNCRGPLLAYPAVTLARLAVTPGETIHVPDSGYTIGTGYEVLVLYASPDRITLKYTRDDNVMNGYTLHLVDICVEPSLLALYQTWNSSGRGQLPALRPGQAFGRARGDEIGLAIRDNGAFMDPRSRKDWWQEP
jgi:hypothetical protein